jgi:circadian clock protein KaiC
MSRVISTLEHERNPLPKTLTGIAGLDEITGGGLPKGRTALVVGGPGCGKTLLAMEFLVHGALVHGEPGVCLQFEETEEKLAANVSSLGLDLRALEKKKKLLLDHIRIDRNEIEENGEYNLDGLFIRLGLAVDTIKAKRVVMDGIETLFAGLSDEAALRSELRRLFRWLDEHKLTAIVTGERGDRTLTRHGLEEYIADCVILMDHRVTEQLSTRRLRIVKYRGSPHGTDEYPFLIDDDGIFLMPVTSLALTHQAHKERVSTGLAALDAMLDGKGFFRGSSILVSGSAGTGKSSIGAKFADAACARGETCLYFSFEESPSQIVRNMSSIGVPLAAWVRKGLLQFHAVRPTSTGLEGHLASMQKLISNLEPRAVVIDPVTSILSGSNMHATKLMFTRLIDFLKVRGITSLFTNLTDGRHAVDGSYEGVSSLMDTWIALSVTAGNGSDPKRILSIVKSRGMPHSREIRELVVSKGRLDLLRLPAQERIVVPEIASEPEEVRI